VNLNKFAVRVHDVVVGVALLDLKAKVPNTESKAQKDNLKNMKRKLEESGFVWGPLAGFLTCGVRGLLLVTRDHREITVGNCMALLSAAEEIQKLDNIQIKETIWVRTHDYIMRLLKKGYLVSQGNIEAGDILVSKVQLATCIAYDIGYYWSVQVPGLSCAYLPEAYIPLVKVVHAQLPASEQEPDAMDTDS
jgi:hypothetical protein